MKTRNQDYYISLVEKMGDEIKSTSEVYTLIEKTDAEFGLSCPKNLLSCVMSRFCDILDGALTIVEDTDTKRRGRGVPMLYQVNNVGAAIEKIKSMKATKTVKKEKKVKENVDLKSTLEHLYKQLEVAYDAESRTITLSQPRMKLLKTNHIETVIFADWSQEKKNILRFMNSGDIKKSMLTLDSMYKEKFGSDLGACTKFNIVKVTTREKTSELSEVDEKYILWIVMKVISKERNLVEVTSLLKILREQIGVSIDRHTLIDLCKSIESLSISMDKQKIGFGIGAKIDELLRTYSPENYKRKIYARIGMRPEEVIQYFPEAIQASKISENDGIYEITVDRTFKSRATLLKLYRTFRGTDMIFGSEDIVDYLKIQMAKADGLYKHDSFLYKLETM